MNRTESNLLLLLPSQDSVFFNGVIATTAAVLAVQLFTSSNPLGSTFRLLGQFRKQEKALTSGPSVKTAIDEYNRLHSTESADERNANYKSLVNSYYDLATLFYEWGWGSSFHFAHRQKFESFAESIRKHEYFLASKLNLTKEKRDNDVKLHILDVGCGIGGPMRNICRFTGCDITGITLNEYQVRRGNELCINEFGSNSPCRSIQGDFMQMEKLESDSFDAAYAIEATCHAPNRATCYREIFRVLKPGAIFACYEWCVTDKYNPKNSDHCLIKKQIEEGDGLPDLAATSVCSEALVEAGFELLEERDMALAKAHYSWYLPLTPSWNPFTQRFQFNWLGLKLTKYALKIMEFLWLAPTGTSKTQVMLQTGGIGCANGGLTGVFTPMYLMVGRVPTKKATNATSKIIPL